MDEEEKKAAFKEYMKKVDRALEDVCGLSSDDLTDWNYGDAFESGTDPAEVAQEVLSENGYDELCDMD